MKYSQGFIINEGIFIHGINQLPSRFIITLVKHGMYCMYACLQVCCFKTLSLQRLNILLSNLKEPYAQKAD